MGSLARFFVLFAALSSAALLSSCQNQKNEEQAQRAVQSFLEFQGAYSYEAPLNFSACECVTEELASELNSQFSANAPSYSEGKMSVRAEQVSISFLKKESGNYIFSGSAADVFSFASSAETKQEKFEGEFHVRNINGKFLVFSVKKPAVQ